MDAAAGGDYVDSSTRTLDFSNFENLTGGTDADILVMQLGGSLLGAFDGGLGMDTATLGLPNPQQFLVLGSAGPTGTTSRVCRRWPGT